MSNCCDQWISPARNAMPRHWSVRVEVDGGSVVSIGEDWLSGRALSEKDERAIFSAARHLLSFIGFGLSPAALDGCGNILFEPSQAIGDEDAELADWEKLCDPAVRHANLLRRFPERLPRDQLTHPLGTDTPAHEPHTPEMAMLIKQLASRLRRLDASSRLPTMAIDYLQRHGFLGSPLRSGAEDECARSPRSSGYK